MITDRLIVDASYVSLSDIQQISAGYLGVLLTTPQTCSLAGGAGKILSGIKTQNPEDFTLVHLDNS
jgi:hypothetical protein